MRSVQRLRYVAWSLAFLLPAVGLAACGGNAAGRLDEPTIGDAPGEEAGFSTLDAIES